MTDYQFIIPNKKRNIYFAFAIGIIVLNTIGFAVLYYIENKLNRTGIIFVCCFLALLLILFYIFSPEKRMALAGTFILLSGLFWMKHGQYNLFIGDIILWALYTVSRRTLVIKINEDNISYPSFPAKEIAWKDVNNLILKDDILTIDLNNNKIYQPQIVEFENPTNEKEFNEFCKSQLLSGR